MYTFKELIAGDLHRYEAKCTGKAFFHAYCNYEGFRFSVWLRSCYCARRNRITKVLFMPILRTIYNHYRYKYGYDISYGVAIGPGLLLLHFGGIVLTAQSVGKNFTISHGTTVGMKLYDGKKVFPKLGNDIYMAPGSKIIGDVEIGNNVAIGTNSVVLKSIADNSVVVGIPGKVVSQQGAGGYVPNRISW